MVLGPQEYEKRRMVDSASTPLAMWRKLIKKAGLTVLRVKRLEDPRNKEKWRLRFHNHNVRFPSSSISVFDVSKVGSRSFCVLTRLVLIPKVVLDWLAVEVDPPLIKHITFTKVKATADDVLVILRTLYERAADLGIDAKTRISFHADVLLAAEGGFRPGTLGNYLRI